MYEYADMWMTETSRSSCRLHTVNMHIASTAVWTNNEIYDRHIRAHMHAQHERDPRHRHLRVQQGTATEGDATYVPERRRDDRADKLLFRWRKTGGGAGPGGPEERSRLEQTMWSPKQMQTGETTMRRKKA